MKNYKTVLVLIGLAILIAFSSCSKYEENTGISLRSKRKRAEGNWEITKYEVNGIDSLELRGFPVTKLRFTDVHDDEHIIPFVAGEYGGGYWYFESDKEIIDAHFDPPTQLPFHDPFKYLTQTGTGKLWKILRLKEKEMYLSNDADQGETFNVRIEMTKIK
ncbi:MAG: hypothetical protein ACI87N_002596 [Flavobacteriales bacterium]|jgi:hypothetical protein